MSPEKIFESEHKRLSDDWFVKMRRQIIMGNGNENVLFQEWVIAQLAVQSAALKRLLLEARNAQG